MMLSLTHHSAVAVIFVVVSACFAIGLRAIVNDLDDFDSVADVDSVALGPWSPWSSCNVRCRQRRHRTCLVADKCDKSSRYYERRRCGGGVCPIRRHQDLVRPADPEMDDGTARGQVSLRHRDLYSEWTIWSRCTRRCRKRRYRYCQEKSACGNDVLSEEMPCAPKGSQCERKLVSAIKDQQSAAVDTGKPSAPNNPSSNQEVPTKSKLLTTTMITTRNTDLPSGFDSSTCGMRHKEFPESRIFGGKQSKHGKWPWQVALLNRFKEPYCGGTLVADQWVLTAAHCIKRRVFALAGDHNFRKEEGTEQLFKIIEAYPHPDYDSSSYDNDIGLIKLERPVEMGEYVKAACLPSASDALHESSTSCYVMGWGKRRDSHTYGTDVLYEAQVPIVGHNQCQEAYDNFHITENMMCAGYERGKADSCGGDSGGPLMCQSGPRQNWYVLGITSFGEGCGGTGKYGVYSKVTNYLAWIHRVIRSMEEPTYRRRHSKGKRSSGGMSPLDIIMMRIKNLLMNKFTFF